MRLRDQRISPHFRWREFEDRHTGKAVPIECRPGVRRLCEEVLEPMRAKLGPCHVWSGYRTEATNRAVGGAPRSHHVYTWWPDSPAADVSFQGQPPHEAAAVAEELGVGGLGQYLTHIHVDQRPGKVRW